MSVVHKEGQRKHWPDHLINFVIFCERAYRDFEISMMGRFLLDRFCPRKPSKPR